MKGNFHVRFLEELGRVIAPSYSANEDMSLFCLFFDPVTESKPDDGRVQQIFSVYMSTF